MGGQISYETREGMNMSNDPWKNRSEGMRCKTCVHYVTKAADDHVQTGIGRCRKHAPTMNGFPVVFEDDWCGDHRLDENKYNPETVH